VKFSWDAMNQAEESLRRLADFADRLDRVTAAGSHADIAAKVTAAEAQFVEAMEQDLNTAGALGAIFELVRSLNAAIDNNELGGEDAASVKSAFERFDVLGSCTAPAGRRRAACRPGEIGALVGARQDARSTAACRGRSHSRSSSRRASCSRTRPRARWKASDGRETSGGGHGSGAIARSAVKIRRAELEARLRHRRSPVSHALRRARHRRQGWRRAGVYRGQGAIG
jgi:hypothetical protein